MTLAFGYVRASTIEEVKQGSNERQKEQIRALAKLKGYEIRFFEDKAITGKNDNRPQFRKMISLIPGKRPTALIVSKIDRFARSLKDLQNNVEYLQEHDSEFISVNDPGIDTTTPNGKLLLQILGAFAEFEVNMINARTKAGIESAKLRGVKFGRPALKTSSKNGSKFIDPKRVIEMHQKGISARAISKDLVCSVTPVLKIIKNETQG